VPVYNKAVRDRIPEIIEESGNKCEYQTLSDEEFLPLLEAKLGEELEEYMSSKNLVELADVLEVIHRLAALKGSNIAELEEIRRKKKAERGGFERNLFLVKTLD